ncbi:MAG: HipA domain-containing protein, partial [Planctomycetes bacterium]|nr:HipA domain-containing protein [Planctomycetota bacterium]
MSERPTGIPPPARCLATLAPLAAEGMVDRAQRELAGGNARFPSRIAIVRQDVVQYRLQAMQRFSISGVQDKISMRLERGRLRAVERDGTHILKPIPSSPLPLVADVPANEHVTMLAARALGIRTAACALIRLQDDELAYVTRRFDRRPDGSKLLQEDFGVLAGMSEAESGKNYKYSSSYEELGRLVALHCSARQRDLEEYFRRVVFCFAVGNGDAHVRNFSILREVDGFVELSPAYDLLCTNVHLPDESDLALSILATERHGIFSTSFEALGSYSAGDFRALAEAIGLHADARDRV